MNLGLSLSIGADTIGLPITLPDVTLDTSTVAEEGVQGDSIGTFTLNNGATGPVTLSGADFTAGYVQMNADGVTLEYGSAVVDLEAPLTSLSFTATPATGSAASFVLTVTNVNEAPVGASETFNFDVTPAAGDVTAPTLLSSSPSDDAIDVAVDSNITITFSENIQFGTGNITIKLVGGANLEVFDVTSDTGGGAGTVSISGAVLTIEPTSDFSNSANIAVQIDATAIEDLAGNAFAGIADDTTLNFTTIAGAGAVSNPVAFDGVSDFVNNFGMSDGAEFAFACRVRITGASNVWFIADVLDTYLKLGTDNNISMRIEDSASSLINLTITATSPIPDDTWVSVFWVVDLNTGAADGAAVLTIDGTDEITLSGLTSSGTVKTPNFMAAANASPYQIAAMDVDGMWISNASGAGALTYGDFFDGSNDWLAAAQAATVGGVTAAAYEFGNAAAWNAQSWLSGSVADTS